jgi:hypothetical protein
VRGMAVQEKIHSMIDVGGVAAATKSSPALHVSSVDRDGG